MSGGAEAAVHWSHQFQEGGGIARVWIVIDQKVCPKIPMSQGWRRVLEETIVTAGVIFLIFLQFIVRTCLLPIFSTQGGQTILQKKFKKKCQQNLVNTRPTKVFMTEAIYYPRLVGRVLKNFIFPLIIQSS